MILGTAAAVAFVVAFVVVRMIERRAASLRLLDLPNPRSSHVAARPRGGGVGIVLGTACGLGVCAAMGLTVGHAPLVILVASLFVAAVGLRDDMASIGVTPRLVVYVGAAAAVVFSCGWIDRVPLPPPLDLPVAGVGVAMTIVWIVGVTNFFNFMDGADGLAGGQACLTFAALAAVSWPSSIAILSIVGIAATGAFLVRNWSPARIFLGDVGSCWLGFVLASLPLAASGQERADLLLVVALSLTLFLLDPLCTLLGRMRRGAPLVESHREHAYQRLFPPSGSHARVVSALLAAAAMLSAVAAVAYRNPAATWGAIGLALLVFVVEWTLATRVRLPDPRDRA